MAMQGRGNAINYMIFVAALVVATTVLQSPGIEAKNHIVGGAKKWDYPMLADTGFYDMWAAQQTFLPGDTLTFTYTPAEHDTTIVTATEYASCRMSTGKKYTTGTDVVTLAKPGTYYFYCGVIGHCEMGMKMKVVVPAAVTPILPPALPPSAVPVEAPVKAPVEAPVAAPVPVPVPAPALVPVPVPVPSPAELPPTPLAAVPDVAPTPVDAFVPVAAPTPEDSSASSLAVVGFQLLAVGFASLFLF